MASSKPPKANVEITKQPKFDLESYISNYRGRTRVERLLFIGSNSSVLGVEALKLAVHEAKKGKDVKLYLEAQSHLERICPCEPEAQKDTTWVTNTETSNYAETQRLEAELKQYKNNLIKESIRMGNEDLGKHYHAIGDLSRSFDAFGRMRQDAMVPKHITDLSLHLIEVAIEQRNWFAVTSNVQKMKQIIVSNEEHKALQPFLYAADGLAHMSAGRYFEAAGCFLNAESKTNKDFNNILSPNDIAIYGGLCALAVLERTDLNNRVLENSNFRTYLELEPHIRRAITFINNRYSACLGILDAYRVDFSLDLYLHRQIDEICMLVRKKSIVQYFAPFSCVTIDSLNEIFAPPGQNILRELIKMIESGSLNARIDTLNSLIIALPSKPRHTLHTDTLETARVFEHDARLQIQHSSICCANVDIKSEKTFHNPNTIDGSPDVHRDHLRRADPGVF